MSLFLIKTKKMTLKNPILSIGIEISLTRFKSMIAKEMLMPHKLYKLWPTSVKTKSSKTAGKLLTLSKMIMKMTIMVKSCRSNNISNKKRARRDTTRSMNKKNNSQTKRKKRKKRTDQKDSM